MGSYDRYLKDAVDKYGNVLEFKKGDISLLLQVGAQAKIMKTPFRNDKELAKLMDGIIVGVSTDYNNFADTIKDANFRLANIFSTYPDSDEKKMRLCIDGVNSLISSDIESEFATYKEVVKKYFPKWISENTGILLTTKDNDKLGYVAGMRNDGKYDLSLKYGMLNVSSDIFEFDPNELNEDSEGYRSYVISEDKLIMCMHLNNVLWTPAFHIKESPIFINYSKMINGMFYEGYSATICMGHNSFMVSSNGDKNVRIYFGYCKLPDSLNDILLYNGMNCNSIMNKSNFINMVIKDGFIIS